MKKIIFIAVFILFSILQISILSYIIISNKMDLKNSPEVALKCIPYDPYDAYEGRFVIFRLDIQSTPLKSLSYNGLKKDSNYYRQYVYCVLKKKDKYFYIDEVHEKKPENKLFIKVKAYISGSDKDSYLGIYLDEANRYYMQEDFAKKSDLILRDTKKSKEIFVTAAVTKDGKMLIKNLFVENMKIEDYLIKSNK